MSSQLIEVVVPGPWWNALTYEAPFVPEPGSRVRVPVGRGERIGFVAGPARERPKAALRSVHEVLDERGPLGAELWELMCWVGRTFLCGTGMVLKTACPAKFLEGAPLDSPFGGERKGGAERSAFCEEHCFIPWDEERAAFYRAALERPCRTLVLFSEAATARRFFASLPAHLKAEAVLWPSSGGKKLWDAWREVRSGNARIVVAPPGGVYAPMAPGQVVVDDEASPAYVPQRAPRVSARSVAGRRAFLLGARLILGGRMPSSKTFLRAHPACEVLPDRDRMVFVDVRRSLKGRERGVEGDLSLTVSLLDRTRRELGRGRHVLWMLDRRGEAAEVFCVECGHSPRCPRCGGVMRSESSGQALRCIRCGRREALPERCPDCGGGLWSGRRPGLEALASMAGRLMPECPVLLHEEGRIRAPEVPSLLLGTRGALALCDRLDVGLAAWLDLDAELRRPEYGARFQAFSMVWESYWRGRRAGDDPAGRTVLIQGRRFGAEWRAILSGGWERFWRGELALRSELALPPVGLMIQIDLPEGEDRAEALRTLEDAGLFVMDPGEPGAPLWVNASSPEPVARALAPRFAIGRSRLHFPSVTVWAE